MFVFLQFFGLFLITSLITSTVFLSHGLADCRLSLVCVYLQPSIYISDSLPLLLPYCLFIHSFQRISGYLVNVCFRAVLISGYFIAFCIDYSGLWFLAQNRDYNRSLAQVCGTTFALRMLFYASIYLLGRWRRRLALVCNNQNHVTSLKMLDDYRT